MTLTLPDLIGLSGAQALGTVGIADTDELAAIDPADVERVAPVVGVAPDRLAWWRALACVGSLPGITVDAAWLLVGCGVRSLHDLASDRPARLHAALRLSHAMRTTDAPPPTPEAVSSWVEFARSVVEANDLRP